MANNNSSHANAGADEVHTNLTDLQRFMTPKLQATAVTILSATGVDTKDSASAATLLHITDKGNDNSVSVADIVRTLIKYTSDHTFVNWRVGVSSPITTQDLAQLGPVAQKILMQQTVPAVMELEIQQSGIKSGNYMSESGGSGGNGRLGSADARNGNNGGGGGGGMNNNGGSNGNNNNGIGINNNSNNNSNMNNGNSSTALVPHGMGVNNGNNNNNGAGNANGYDSFNNTDSDADNNGQASEDIYLNLWRADMLSCVMEVEHNNGIVHAIIKDPLCPPSLIFGKPIKDLEKKALSSLIRMESSDVGWLYSSLRRTAGKSALKQGSSVPNSKPGPVRELQAYHIDQRYLSVTVQAVPRETMKTRSYVVFKVHHPIKGDAKLFADAIMEVLNPTRGTSNHMGGYFMDPQFMSMVVNIGMDNPAVSHLIDTLKNTSNMAAASANANASGNGASSGTAAIGAGSTNGLAIADASGTNGSGAVGAVATGEAGAGGGGGKGGGGKEWRIVDCDGEKYL
uniref:Uncharacterized protein n=1 Tax=Polytomella parva TaxID=51329 RepID=A0A7S0UV80_9CHLO